MYLVDIAMPHPASCGRLVDQDGKDRGLASEWQWLTYLAAVQRGEEYISVMSDVGISIRVRVVDAPGLDAIRPYNTDITQQDVLDAAWEEYRAAAQRKQHEDNIQAAIRRRRDR